MDILGPLSMGWVPWKTSVLVILTKNAWLINDPICEPIDDDEPQTVHASGFSASSVSASTSTSTSTSIATCTSTSKSLLDLL